MNNAQAACLVSTDGEGVWDTIGHVTPVSRPESQMTACLTPTADARSVIAAAKMVKVKEAELKRVEAQPDPLQREPQLRARMAALGQEAAQLVSSARSGCRLRLTRLVQIMRCQMGARTVRDSFLAISRARLPSVTCRGCPLPVSRACTVIRSCHVSQAVDSAKTVAEMWEITQQMAPLTLGIDEANALVRLLPHHSCGHNPPMNDSMFYALVG